MASATSKMTSWQPLDLNNLGRGSVFFFKKYIFKIRASSWEKWAIAWLSSQTFKISIFSYFLVASEDRRLKNGIFKSLTRKSSYSSFFSAWSPDFKNVIFEKIHLAHSEVVEVAEVIFEVAEAKFWISSSFYKFSFRIFVILDFEVVWPRRPRRPQNGPSECFQKLHFLNQCIQRKKMRHVSAF